MPDVHADSGLPTHVRGTALTVGTFDGVHLGHFDVLRQLVALASERGLASVLVTFAPHPTEIVRPHAVPQLLTPGLEKFEALATIGLDYCAVLPFTRQLASLTAAAFVRDILRPRFRMETLLIGHDHGFGRDRAGGRDQLLALGAADGFHVQQVAPVALPDGSVVSSSKIRAAIAAGDLASAAAGLGRPYSLSGTVLRGDQRGRTIGFPTANLGVPPARKLLPPDGVYAAVAQTRAGPVPAMVNLGGRPTVADARTTVEAHLLDFDGDLYGANLRLDFCAWIRPIQRFNGLAELSAQLEADRVAARTALTRFA